MSFVLICPLQMERRRNELEGYPILKMMSIGNIKNLSGAVNFNELIFDLLGPLLKNAVGL